MDFNSFLWGLFGSGTGGALVLLAAKKVIDDRIEARQKPMWEAINKIKDEYQPKYACKIIHEYAEKDTKRIEETLQRIEELIRNQQKIGI